MSSSHSSTQSDSASTASDALAPPAETVRSCADRERRLTEYIRAHTGEDIAVRLTPHVPTACVIPTSEEALIDSDNAEFSDDEARQLVESVDADYLVLISTHPANVDNLPIDDQLTADRAQQFGYALHELGHIRYTAIADAAERLEERVDKQHQEFVHGLWNSCEDAAIENQLAVDQSQLAADRLELVSRSISTHADEFAAEECYEFTFRDAIETALYDEGIYDTGIRDALCDPNDGRLVFAGDADQQAFEQVADSIEDLVATILTTPGPIGRVEHVLDWWETAVKPLLDPSEHDDQDDQQGIKQPDPDGAAGESSTNASASANPDTDISSDPSSDGRETDQSTAEDADSSQSSEREEPDESNTVDGTNSTDEPENGGRNKGATTEETGATSEIDEAAGSQSEQRPDPDAINTDQRQPSPGADALDYPDIGGSEDAGALDQPESDGGGESKPEPESDAEAEAVGGDESEETTESQSPRGTANDTQATESDHDSESGLGAADDGSVETDADTTAADAEAGDEDTNGETPSTVGDSDSDTSRDDEGDTGDAAENSTDTGGREETVGGDDEQSTPEHGSDASHGDITSATGEGSEQSSKGEPEGATPESQSDENPWGTTNSNSTSQTSLGSFSAPSSQTENESGSTDGDESDTGDNPGDITPGTGDESTNDEETTGSGNVDENARDEEPTESSDVGSSIGDESGDREERAEAHTRTTDEDGNDATGSDGDEEHADTPPESDEPSPAPRPAHADGEACLDREGALGTDHEAAHDEAERATPDETALEHELEDVADALDALGEQDGGGAAPGSLSELAIMPDTEGSNTADTAERWGDAAADAEFVADALRKALKESHRDANRSGVTSGTFDRQRAGALARGDVGAFSVRQPGDDKQYDLVMILDRSGSMRRHIDTAEDALVRFALACEDIGINVGVVDFTQGEARLVKPFSVECEHVRESLLSKQYGGGTPLADALGLGRELLEQRRNSPLVLVVTDGKPGDEDTYHDELAQSYAPVCGLTLVLDQPAGSVPEKVARNERFYDRHVYVHEPSQLANRLDQFAVMFDGL
jgi:hypothetical protein